MLNNKLSSKSKKVLSFDEKMKKLDRLIKSRFFVKKFLTMAKYYHPVNKNVTVKVLIGEHGSHTNGKDIQLSVQEKYIKQLSIEEVYSIMLKGVFVHELEHNISSDFEEFQTFIKECSEYFATKYKVSKSFGQKVGVAFMNGTEDGRIERIAGERVPYYAEIIRTRNLIVRDNQPLTEQMLQNELQVFFHQIVSYAVAGLLQKDIEKFLDDKHELIQTIEKLKPIIDQIKMSNTAKEVRPLCWEMIKISEDYIAKKIEEGKEKAEQSMENMPSEPDFSGGEGQDYEPNEEQGQGQSSNAGINDDDFKSDDEKDGQGQGNQDEQDQDEDKDGKGNGEENEEDGSDEDDKDGSSSGKDSDDENSDDKKDSSGDGDENEEQNDSDGEEGKQDNKPDKNKQKEGKKEKSSGNGGQPAGTPEQVEQAIQDEIKRNRERFEQEGASEINRIEKQEKKAIEKDEKENGSVVSKKDIEKMVDKHYKGDSQTMFKQERRKNFADFVKLPVPSELSAEARKYKEKIKNLLEEEVTSLHGLDEGMIDVSLLHKVKTNSKNVFYQNEQPTSDTAIAFLLDGSGSMSGYSERQLRKMMTVFEEIFIDQFTMNIQIFSTTYGATVHHVVKEWNDMPKPGHNYSWNGLEARHAGGGNKDGYSIRVMTKELEARQEERKILFILSDGLPSDYNGGYAAGKVDVRSAVLEARKKGISVIPIMFGDNNFLTREKDTFHEMYGKHVIAVPREEILPRLVKILKKFL